MTMLPEKDSSNRPRVVNKESLTTLLIFNIVIIVVTIVAAQSSFATTIGDNRLTEVLSI
jgi:hypothetical protein